MMWGVLVDLGGRGIEPIGGNKRVRLKDGIRVFPGKAAAKRWMLLQIAKAGHPATEQGLEDYQDSLDTLDFFHLKPIVLSEAYKKATGEG